MMSTTTPQRTATADRQVRAGGISLTAGAAVLLAANPVFPRADDPWDVVGVLTMMVDNQVLRQVSFLAITAGLWAVTAGLIGIGRAIPAGPGQLSGRLGGYLALVGVTLFTAAAALGMAATGAAVDWAAAGGDAAGPEYAVAAALNRADDGVWFLSIVAYWGALALYGLAMLRSRTLPRWLGTWLLVVGATCALGVGLPLAVGVEATGLLVGFGVLGALTTLWALVAGIWTLRTRLWRSTSSGATIGHP